ncbi:cardiolipin synthase [Marisediminicola senii]|uniref:cardiolipin synthase n=1 Tax=Marisediminicola senii TaxID=2711233 RepID=UPI0013EAA380|nr:cardiolipin synthase [Marisediminicola senii]
MDAAWIAPTLAAIAIVVDLAIRIGALIVVPINRRPQTATAWLLAIFLIPYVGFLLFLLIGSTKLPKSRRDKQLEISTFIIETTDGIEDVSRGDDWPEWLDSVVELNRTLGAMPLVGGSSATLFADYDETLVAMAAEIDTAERYVHAEFYIISFDETTRPFFDSLEAAVKRGVTVRVLLDHIASVRSPGYRATIRKLKSIGVLWQLMLPVQPWRGRYQRPDLRNHRKLLVVDGDVAFTGSQNIIDRSYNKRGNIRRGLHWKDLMVRFDGPVVAGINALFVTDWYSETDELLLRETQDEVEESPGNSVNAQVVPSGPGFDGENNLRLFNAMLYAAQERVVITSPYFVPDDSMLYAITTAAQRGLDVQLFVSEVADQPVVYHAQRSYYEVLLRAGVQIWLYPAPTVLHAKHFTIDNEVAVIGSSNMDMRSFTLNLEVSIMVHGEAFVDALRRVEDEYRVVSRMLTLEEWLERPFRSSVLDNLARLSSAVQ